MATQGKAAIRSSELVFNALVMAATGALLALDQSGYTWVPQKYVLAVPLIQGAVTGALRILRTREPITGVFRPAPASPDSVTGRPPTPS